MKTADAQTADLRERVRRLGCSVLASSTPTVVVRPEARSLEPEALETGHWQGTRCLASTTSSVYTSTGPWVVSA